MYYRNANCAVVVYDITQAVRRSYRSRSLDSPRSELTVYPVLFRQSQSLGEGTPTPSQ